MATRPAIFKWRQTEPVLILCAIRWYLRYSLSLRDVEELLDERGLQTIDSAGATIDFLLSALRDADAAKRLFRKELSDRSHPQPRVINTDLAPIYSAAIADIKKEGTLRRRCRHRPVQYLNNILEQDH
jgi:transposase, IS6 family